MKKLLPFLAFSFSFSLSFAYTAADVYGAWNKSGSLEVGFGSDPTYTTKGYIRILDLTTIVFKKNDDEWSFIQGKIIKFPNSYQWCELTSNKMMVCHTDAGKKTFKKAGTLAQYENALKKAEKMENERKQNVEKEYLEKNTLDCKKQTFLYGLFSEMEDNLKKISGNYKNLKKDDFESTADFNKRAKASESLLKDSTQAFFLRESAKAATKIIAYGIDFAFPLSKSDYNADKEIFEYKGKYEKYYRDYYRDGGLSCKEFIDVQTKMPPSEARSIDFSEEARSIDFSKKENTAKNLKFHFSEKDLMLINNLLFATKMKMYVNGNEYDVIVNVPKDAKKIEFIGNELWSDNPYAKNLKFSIDHDAIRDAMVAKIEEDETKKINALATIEHESIKIGNRVWMGRNLDLDIGNSECKDNKPKNCEMYGRLYDWTTAKAACPKGWHLPSNDEWDELKLEIKGQNDNGFAIFRGENKSVDGYGSYYWWSATEHNANEAYFYQVYNDYGYMRYDLLNKNKSSSFPVRCLKDGEIKQQTQPAQTPQIETSSESKKVKKSKINLKEE